MARGELGARVRRARERGPRALKVGVLSQRSASEQIGRGHNWWGDLEAGKVDPSLCDLEAIADLLWVDLPYLLGLTAGKLSAEESVDRRTFVAGMAGLAVGIDLERLAYPSLDAAWLAGAEAVTRALTGQWYVVPPASLLPAVSGQVAALRGLLPGPRQLSALAGRAALLEAMLLIKLDRRPEAFSAYALAEVALREAGDAAHRALTLGMSSSLHSTVSGYPRPGDTQRALGLLDASVEIAGPAAPGRIRAALLNRRAEERAVMGDATGAMSDLAAAADALTNPGEEWSSGARTAVETAPIRGNVQLLLGQNREAVVTLDEALATMDPKLISWRAAVLADQGAAFARSGEIDAAVDRLERALQLAKTAGDHRSRVAGIRQRDLERWTDEPAVARLDEQLGA